MNKKIFYSLLSIILASILIYQFISKTNTPNVSSQKKISTDKIAIKTTIKKERTSITNSKTQAIKNEISDKNICNLLSGKIHYTEILKIMKKYSGSFNGFPGLENEKITSNAAKFFLATNLGGYFYNKEEATDTIRASKLLYELSKSSPNNMAYQIFLLSVERANGFPRNNKKILYSNIMKATYFDSHYTTIGRKLYLKASSLDEKIDASLLMASIPLPSLSKLLKEVKEDLGLAEVERVRLLRHLGQVLVKNAQKAKYPSFVWGYSDYEYSIGKSLLSKYDGRELISFIDLNLQMETYYESEEYYKEMEILYESCE